MKLYKYFTGPDDESFCRRVTEALNKGWQLYGNPTLTFNGQTVIAGQALIKEKEGDYSKVVDLKSA